MFTFVSGLSKWPLWSVNLLVISFSVINYVVSMSCRREVTTHFFTLPACPWPDFLPLPGQISCLSLADIPIEIKLEWK